MSWDQTFDRLLARIARVGKFFWRHGTYNVGRNVMKRAERDHWRAVRKLQVARVPARVWFNRQAAPKLKRVRALSEWMP